ncbi:MAG: hypothetical protein AAFO94_01655 [Bacteroidota bacterium]
MKKNLLLAGTLLCLLACQPSIDHFGTAKDYLPEPALLAKGVVNKYYNQIKGHEKNEPKLIDIFYMGYQLNDEGHIVNNFYFPDYTPSILRKLNFENGSMQLLSETRHNNRGESYELSIEAPAMRHLDEPATSARKKIDDEFGLSMWEIEQHSNRDTTVMGRPAKILEGTEYYSFKNETEQNDNLRQFKEVYVQGIGLYSRVLVDSLRSYRIELVEQIPMAQFERQANHEVKRVAYINPDSAMDKATPFDTCEEYIWDYYNGEQKLHYRGGKRAIWDTVALYLDKKKLLKESGYLTFRFVINCEGKMGRITTEQADLDFQPKEFSYITIHHFYEMLEHINDWIPTHVNDENVDAYFYLTFKLKDGELIELLP